MNNSLILHTDDVTEVLYIKYNPKNSAVMYDVCDLNGNIIKTGFTSGEEIAISLAVIKPGLYSIFIVDGDQLIKEKFKIEEPAMV